MEPHTRLGLAQLTRLAFQGVNLNPIRTELLNHLVEDNSNAGALMDLSVIDQLNGHQDAGLAWQSRAFAANRLFRTFRDEGAKYRVLVVAADLDIGGNTPVEFLLEGSDFDILVYFPGIEFDGSDLPPHDVIFCAAPGDGDLPPQFFEQLRDFAERSSTRIVNLPAEDLQLSRDSVAELLNPIAGLRAPKTVRINAKGLRLAAKTGIERAILEDVGGYPVVIRPVGSHAGKGLAKVESRAELLDYLSAEDAAHFYVSEFIDYATKGDDQFRKYRVVFVEGVAFPVHVAIAAHWDIWYLNAEMQASPAKRAIEAALMAGFDDGFAQRHGDAFAGLVGAIGLDYFGIDCAEDRDGNLVVFEVDNALIVHDMDPEDVFPYKRRHMHRIFSAFQALLRSRCAPVPLGSKRGSPTGVAPVS